jgi:hypothetical protein
MSMTPEMIQNLMQSGADDPQLAQLKRQQAMADSLRKQSMGSPGMVDAGRLRVAPIGQIASNAMAGYQANQMQPGIDTGMQQAAQRSAQSRQAHADAVAMALRRNYPQSAAPTLPPDGYEDQ